MAPNLIPDIIVIHANALGAALANLNVTDITATQLLDAIKKEGPTIPDQTNTLRVLERKCFPFLYANTLFTMAQWKALPNFQTAFSLHTNLRSSWSLLTARKRHVDSSDGTILGSISQVAWSPTHIMIPGSSNSTPKRKTRL